VVESAARCECCPARCHDAPSGRRRVSSPGRVRNCHAAARLTHVDSHGEASMVDVSAKADTTRTAVAASSVHLGPAAFSALTARTNAKGNVLVTARLAGIMAAKRTSELIPLCHPVALSHVAVNLRERPEAHALDIEATATCTAATGVEMEALTAATVAALTVYDMCKAACADGASTAAALLFWPISAHKPTRASKQFEESRPVACRSKDITISDVRLLSKSGGQSGKWQAEAGPPEGQQGQATQGGEGPGV